MLILSIGPLQIADPVAPDPPPPVIDTVGTLVYPVSYTHLTLPTKA